MFFSPNLECTFQKPRKTIINTSEKSQKSRKSPQTSFETPRNNEKQVFFLIGKCPFQKKKLRRPLCADRSRNGPTARRLQGCPRPAESVQSTKQLWPPTISAAKQPGRRKLGSAWGLGFVLIFVYFFCFFGGRCLCFLSFLFVFFCFWMGRLYLDVRKKPPRKKRNKKNLQSQV